MLSSFICLFVCVCFLPTSWQHGFLWEPPSRSSAWRKGFDNPPNYNDNELNCGGYSHQWDVNGGKCGECGDPWDMPVGERPNQAGGMYANGVIVGSYNEGQTIDIEIDITANHMGWFEFRLCVNNDHTKAATQECLDQNLLELPNGNTQWMLESENTGIYSMQLKLPAGVTCTQCVLQWKWHCGNNWGTAPNGTECVGCNPAQEEFYGCADIAISGDGGGTTTTDAPGSTTTAGSTTETTTLGSSTTSSQTTTTPATTTTAEQTTQTTTAQSTTSAPDGECGDWEWIAAGAPDEELDQWCKENCEAPQPYCPEDSCRCNCYEPDC